MDEFLQSLWPAIRGQLGANCFRPDQVGEKGLVNAGRYLSFGQWGEQCLPPLGRVELAESNRREGFPCGTVVKNPPANVGDAGDLGLISGLGTFPREGKGYSFQCSGLENSMNCIVHGVTKNRTQLSDFHFQVSTKSAALA